MWSMARQGQRPGGTRSQDKTINRGRSSAPARVVVPPSVPPGPPGPVSEAAEPDDAAASLATADTMLDGVSPGDTSGDNTISGEGPPGQTSAAPPEEKVFLPPQPPLLFEIAWEVCWQLGGIYTVLRSKAGAMLERWGDRYCLIGPYNPNTAPLEFEEQPAYGSIKETLTRLRDAGLPCYFGRWLIDGRPRVILIDYRARFGSLDQDKYLLWENHGISTNAGDGEVNEVVAFGFAVTEFFRQLSSIVKDRPILAHFHEWMAGVAVPRIAHLKIPVCTIFTTHATLLGRYIAGENPFFYDHLPFLDAEAEARKYNIHSRWSIEKAATHAAAVFSTVSEVTAFEAAKLLGREADVIMPNGLNIRRFAAPHEFQYLHQEYKERIHAFVMGHFFPSYSFDLDNTIYLFTSGRYEYRNKGMDLYIEALAELNRRLRQMSKPPTVIAFIITKAAVKNINVSVLQNQSMFDDLRHTCNQVDRADGPAAVHVGGDPPHADLHRIAAGRLAGAPEAGGACLAHQPPAADRDARSPG
jgi:glycogen(starch) synthase